MAVSLSPAGWLQLLERRLEQRWARMAVYDAYFEGDHRLAFATAKWREAFGGLFAAISDNWCPLVVDATVERIKVQGFRFGNEQAADDDAWAIWQANGLDAESDMVTTEAVKLGEAFWLVTPPAPGSSDMPRITAEHPSQMVVACAPDDRRRRLAALKRWWDDDGYVYATLYLPEQIVKWRSSAKGKAGMRVQWVRRPDDPGSQNPLGEVPVIPIRNAPTMLGGGQSDLKDVIPIQDALNKLLSDALIGSEYQAFPQRVLTGVEIPKDPVTGAPVPAAELQASQSRLWTFKNPDVKAMDFKAADLGAYVNLRQHLIRSLTARTRTPPHYVLGEIVNASGDALKAAETGLTSKTKRKLPALGEGHEDMMRLAFKALGDADRAAQLDAEVIWADVETRSFGELIDGLTKLATIDVPREVLWEMAEFSPQQIARMRTAAAGNRLLEAALGLLDANQAPAAGAPAMPMANGNGNGNGAVPQL